MAIADQKTYLAANYNHVLSCKLSKVLDLFARLNNRYIHPTQDPNHTPSLNHPGYIRMAAVTPEDRCSYLD
jgi:hypothetical protein